MPNLRPMNEAEYQHLRRLNYENYPRDRARNLGTPLEQEQEVATEQLDQLLADGLQSPHHRFWVLVESDDSVLGYIWASVDQKHGSAFIFYIIIEEAQRGKGYGKLALDLLEDELRSLGIKRVGLNVFADNTVAQALYEKQGYRTTNYNMLKWI
jgi:RimJ/RimL family protein N-acetyltransferase